MKKLLNFSAWFVFVALLLFTFFFFWASSPNLSEQAYAKVYKTDYGVSTESDSTYTIMTYNIGYLSGMTNNLPVAKPRSLFEENLTKVVSETQKAQPDIIAFQEIDFNAARSYEVNQQDAIARLGYSYVAEAINWDETYVPFPYWPPTMHFGKVVSGQSVLSKFPIKTHERIVLERVADSPFYRDALYLDRLAQVSSIDLDGQLITVINVHLEAFDQPTRTNQMKVVVDLYQKAAEKRPTILLGDFNSDPSFKDAAIQQVFDLPNTGSAAFDAGNYSMTFNSKDPFKRLDYIFYTADRIECLSAKVLDQFGQASDHLPVAMHFRLK